MGKGIAMMLLLASAALAGCSGGTTEEQTTTTITDAQDLLAGKGAIAGLVIDDRYRPVPEAAVTLFPLGLGAVADSTGQFSFVNLDPGAYELRIQAKGHEASPVPVDVDAGEFSEIEVEARRVFSQDGRIVTTEYSVFVPCAVSAPIVTASPDCTGDQSGETNRFSFFSDYTTYGQNATYLITEMLANRKASPENGALKVVIRTSEGGDPYFSSLYTVDSDYLRLRMQVGTVSPDDAEPGRNQNWTNEIPLQTALFAQGQFKGETQAAYGALCTVPQACLLGESRGLGAQFGVKAKFVQSLFLGPPEVDIESYAVLRPSS